MSEYSAYVGLDVHKDTIAVGVAWPGREEPDYRGVMANNRTSLRRLIRKLNPNGEVNGCRCRRFRHACVRDG